GGEPDLDVLLPVAVALPLFGAAALAALTKLLPRRPADLLALGFACATTAICALLTIVAASGPVIHWFGGWTPLGRQAVGVAFLADGFAAGFAAFIGLLVVCALVFSIRFYEAVGTLFQALMLALLAGMVGFAFSADLFDLFVFLELVAATTYALVAYRIQERGPLEASLNTAVTNTVATLVLLIGIALVYGRTGALNLGQVFRAFDGRSADLLVTMALVASAVGFLVKAAAVPFDMWLADAYAVAPIPGGVIFAGVLTEMGLYGLGRIRWTAFAGIGQIARFDLVILAVGAITAVVGALMAVPQRRLKRLVAFVAVAHSGVLLMGLGTGTSEGLAGTALYLLADGGLKAALFLAVGILKHRRGSIHEDRLIGRGRDLHVAGIVFLLTGLGIAGLPPFGTALGKGLIEAAALEHGMSWAPWVLGLTSVLTGGAILRAAGRIFLGWGPEEATSHADEEEVTETEGGRGGTPLVMSGPAAALVVLALAIGCVPRLLHAAHVGALQFREPARYAAALFGSRTAPVSIPPAPPWWDAPTLLSGVLAAVAAVAFALVALDRVRIPARLTRVATRLWTSPMARLRAAHSGHVGDSIAWLVGGAASLGIAVSLILGVFR
ncbi:MAG TPA: proton-conducting transporter membrane subunit, partial [Actinomycetota bacterium]|nr:proton-conducting transporter membrane subunit [Actinomycetota bacterium]